MTSYLSSLTQHYTSLKRLLPNNLSPDSDLSCTDPEDSHVSRVMRAYYQEKGRVFPPWLGPDPRQPERSQPAAVSSSRYGQPQENDDDRFRRSNRGSNTPGALDDLFGNGPPPAQDRGRDQPARGPRGRFNQAPPGREPAPAPTARPLPSQRQGSNQAPRDRFGSGGFGDDRPASTEAAPSREQTAAERLKARLGGARSATPNESSGGYEPPRGGGGNPYDRGGGGGGDRYGGGGSRGNPYQTNSSRNPYGASGGGQPYTGASAPWMSGDDGYGGGGGGGGYGRNGGGGGGGYGDSGGGYGRRAQGLPSNPRRR